MFRRDKDNKLDNEGLRRMREAIRQRLEQEDDVPSDGDETIEASYPRTTAAPSGNDDFGQVAPFNPEELSGYGQRSDEGNYSFLTSGRQERTLPAVQAPAIPVRAETPAWTPTETPAWTPTVTEAPAPVAPSRPAATTIAADTVWRGTLRSASTIQIDGTFDGKIETEQHLIISADAKVEATVHAASITVAGQLNGQINCRERLEILPTGRVSGQIDAGRFIVHEGAYLGGQVRMTGAANADEGARPMLQRVR